MSNVFIVLPRNPTKSDRLNPGIIWKNSIKDIWFIYKDDRWDSISDKQVIQKFLEACAWNRIKEEIRPGMAFIAESIPENKEH